VPIRIFGIENHGLYLRSTGLLVFNSGPGVKDIPVGLGFGKVWNFADGKTINFYMEPQHSVWRSGLGAPGWQLFTGVQLPVSRPLSIREQVGAAI
jgi:hypothetical protein